jgi:hypothetical protein
MNAGSKGTFLTTTHRDISNPDGHAEPAIVRLPDRASDGLFVKPAE